MNPTLTPGDLDILRAQVNLALEQKCDCLVVETNALAALLDRVNAAEQAESDCEFECADLKDRYDRLQNEFDGIVRETEALQTEVDRFRGVISG